jgi:hypothetical protein
MSREGLERLRTLVHADPALALELRRLEAGALKPRLLTIAAERGLDLHANEVDEAVASGARDWMMRWTR